VTFRSFLLALLLALLPGWAQAQSFPALTGRVVDAANILPPETEVALGVRLEALEKQSRRQFVVATIADLQGYPIEDYGYQLGRHWGIGDKQRNDGVLLIVAPADRKVRVEVGYGLEPVLTDALSNSIIQQNILPRFRANDYPGGIVAGADAIIHQLTLPDEEARAIAAKAAQPESTPDIGTFIFWGFFLMFFVMPTVMSFVRGGRRHGHGPVVLWGPTMGSGWGGGSSSGSSWGGGGFSGGGGSFGGGGSSGSW
jgi:uncharacterized protein